MGAPGSYLLFLSFLWFYSLLPTIANIIPTTAIIPRKNIVPGSRVCSKAAVIVPKKAAIPRINPMIENQCIRTSLKNFLSAGLLAGDIFGVNVSMPGSFVIIIACEYHAKRLVSDPIANIGQNIKA